MYWILQCHTVLYYYVFLNEKRIVCIAATLMLLMSLKLNSPKYQLTNNRESLVTIYYLVVICLVKYYSVVSGYQLLLTACKSSAFSVFVWLNI